MKTLKRAAFGLLIAALCAAAPALAQPTLSANGRPSAPVAPVVASPTNPNGVGCYLSTGCPQPTAGSGGKATGTATRPANTTTYTTNTAWANATSGATYTTFANVCRANGATVLITHILIEDFANQTTKLQGVLWLFSAPLATPISDNATFSIASADLANLVTAVPFSTSTVSNQGSGASGSAVADLPGAGLQATCAPTDVNLYGMWQVVNAYVPVSAEVLTGILKEAGVN